MDDEIQEKCRPSFDESLDNMMGKAWNEVKDDFSHGSGRDRVASTAKLLGKGSLYLGAKFIQKLPETLEKMKEKQGK